MKRYTENLQSPQFVGYSFSGVLVLGKNVNLKLLKKLGKKGGCFRSVSKIATCVFLGIW